VAAFARGANGVRAVLAAGGSVPESASAVAALSVELLAPIRPRRDLRIGLNYAKHVEETGGTKPEQPIVFVKVVGSVAPPVVRSSARPSSALDYEAS